MIKMRLTSKQNLLLDVLRKDFNGTAFGAEVHDKSDREEIKQLSVSSITSTLSTLASKGLLDRKIECYNGKMLTKFSLVQQVLDGKIEVELIN